MEFMTKDKTLLNVGIKGSLVAIVLHVATWVAALGVSVGGNVKLASLANATSVSAAQADMDTVQVVGWVYFALILVIVVGVLAHTTWAEPSKEPRLATAASVLLLAIVAFENCLGCALLSYSLVKGDADYYALALVAQLLVSAGSSMICAGYINWMSKDTYSSV